MLYTCKQLLAKFKHYKYLNKSTFILTHEYRHTHIHTYIHICMKVISRNQGQPTAGVRLVNQE